MKSQQQRGFGLIEVMIAMALGLIVVLGISQIFISSRNSLVTQNASAKMQEDARYVLSRMTQELRMAGMLGCVTPTSIESGYDTAFDTPISWDSTNSTLGIITSAPVSGKTATTSSNAKWTLVTDCTTATISPGAAAPAAGTAQVALPIRQVEYKYFNGNLQVREGGSGSFQTLVGGVKAFNVTFGQASGVGVSYIDADSNYTSTPTSGRIRSVRISLTLSDAAAADQTYSVVAALRNRLL